MLMKAFYPFLLLSLFLPELALAQCINPVTMTQEWEIAFNFPNQAMTVEPDQNGDPYIYVAGKEQGLMIYDISDPNSQMLLGTIPPSQLGGLEVMSLTQEGNFLYLALGNHFSGSTEDPGLAIVDVTSPFFPVMKDVFVHPSPDKGGGIVKVQGDRAYLGAMGNGLYILDISDKDNISLVSEFQPSIDFPNPNNPDPAKYNARGMAVDGNMVYLAYDAGGVRIVDVSDENNPVEVGNYSNALLDNAPRAYNNVVLNGELLYVTIDYCGLEILNISDPANIVQVGWWNPWNCETNPLNWFTSAGHTNEIAYDENCQMVFMSTGKSEILAVSVADPAQPESCGSFGSIDSEQGTWGLGLYEDKIYAAYIHVPLGIPFFSNFGGVKEISWSADCFTSVEEEKLSSLSVFPNPSTGKVQLQFGKNQTPEGTLEVFNLLGTLQYQQVLTPGFNGEIDLTFLPAGNYLLKVSGKNGGFVRQLVVVPFERP